jgi:hypothetical protein
MEKRLETKQMKLTKETLKRIIKEELDAVMNEEATPELDLPQQDAKKALEVAKATKDTPKMQAIFDRLEKDPKFMQAIDQMKQEISSTNEGMEAPEGYREVPGESSSGPTAGMAMLGSMVGSVAGWKVLYTSGGAAAVAALAPHYGSDLATAGVVGAAIAAPILFGFILDRVGDAATGGNWNPEIIKKPEGIR